VTRGRRKEGGDGGADRWGRAVRGRERESPGAAGPSAGRESGPRRRKGEWAAGKETGPWGKREMGRAGLKARFAFPYFFSFSFSNQLKSI
jgi:hypothetical protein